MASENYSNLAILLAAPSTDEDDNPDWDAVAWCDSKLREVREVLDALRTSRDCWCVATWKGAHDGRCQRARALRSRLSIEAGEK